MRQSVWGVLRLGVFFVVLAGCSLDWSERGRELSPDAGDDAGADDAGSDVDGPDAAGSDEADAAGDGDAASGDTQDASQDASSDPDAGVPDCASCGENMQCNGASGTCECVAPFVKVAARCEPPVAKLVLGRDRTCALLNDGASDGSFALKCWGSEYYSLYREADASDALQPRSVVGVPRARDMALATGRHCVVLPDADVVRCWGACGKECGLSSGTTTGDVLNDVSYSGVVRISSAMPTYANSGNTCGLTGGGIVSCWGAGGMITLGAADAGRSYPWRVSIEGDSQYFFRDLSAAIYHTCAVTTDKRVACWGLLGTVLGIPDGESNTPAGGVFVQKASGGTLSSVVSVSTGIATSCAVTETGELWCWGPNNLGQLGVGDQAPHLTAVKVPLQNVVEAAAGWQHVCARVASGQVYCWGAVDYLGLGAGVLGDSPDQASFLSPQRVPGLEQVAEIRAHERHSCARLKNGEVVCWGENASGELGDGTTIQRYTPTKVLDLF